MFSFNVYCYYPSRILQNHYRGIRYYTELLGDGRNDLFSTLCALTRLALEGWWLSASLHRPPVTNGLCLKSPFHASRLVVFAVVLRELGRSVVMAEGSTRFVEGLDVLRCCHRSKAEKVHISGPGRLVTT